MVTDFASHTTHYYQLLHNVAQKSNWVVKLDFQPCIIFSPQLDPFIYKLFPYNPRQEGLTV